MGDKPYMDIRFYSIQKWRENHPNDLNIHILARQNIVRQRELEPTRIDFAKRQIERAGFKITFESDKKLCFMFKDKEVSFFPYSGWASGASIEDGRGIKNLIKQLKDGI